MTAYAGQSILDRLKAAISELGYDTVIDDLSSRDEHREELKGARPERNAFLVRAGRCSRQNPRPGSRRARLIVAAIF